MRAISDFDKALQLNEGHALSYSGRGYAHWSAGNYDQALADFDRALKLDPSLAEARQGREQVQVFLRRRADAQTKPPATVAASGETKPAAGTAALPAAAQTDPPARPTAPAAQIAVPAAPADRRIALVIGMSAYANVAPLRNPANDAHAVAEAFRHLGFAEVTEAEDLNSGKLEESLKQFGDRAEEADWAIIYYAGHGVEVNGENYVVPVDAQLIRAEHIEEEAVALSRMLAKTQAARKLRMVIVDACRNNPFRMVTAAGRTRSISRGLLPMEPASGVLVAYAARGGTTVDDGDRGHSPFTAALLANLETPNLDIRIMFSKVRDQVLASTNNSQEPYTYGSLPGEELYFKQAAR